MRPGLIHALACRVCYPRALHGFHWQGNTSACLRLPCTYLRRFFLMRRTRTVSLRVESWAMVSWCLWLGFGASPAAADGDVGAAVSVSRLGTVCGCALPGAYSVHPRTPMGCGVVLTWGAPRTHPAPPCLYFVTELLGPQLSPLNAQFPEVVLQPLAGGGTVGRGRPGAWVWIPSFAETS